MVVGDTSPNVVLMEHLPPYLYSVVELDFNMLGAGIINTEGKIMES